MEYISREELLARQLLALVKHHKEHCNEPDCGVSLSTWESVYEQWKGRKCTQDERQYFR